MKSLAPREANALRLIDVASATLDRDLEPFPTSITSVFGQRIRLIRTDGTWVSNLRFEHVAYIERRIDWGQQYSKCPYIEWMIRSWAIDRLQSVIDTRPLVEILHRISTFDPKGKRAETLAAELYEWLVEQILTCTDEAAPQVVLGCRTLYLWALEEDLPGFNELQYEDLMGHRLARKRNSIVSFRDPDNGPYTPVEVAILTSAIKRCPGVSPRAKAMFLLCRDWGLRPVQIALIRVKDVGCDDLGPYVDVCSVKGRVRSRLRNSPGNQVRRYVQDDTYEAIQAQVQRAPADAAGVIALLNTISEPHARVAQANLPLFPSRVRAKDRLERFCNSERIAPYATHTDSHRIAREISEIGELVAVPLNSVSGDTEGAIMRVTAYRLRRTKGTSLAANGASADEIAAALDHASAGSVEHYLQYSTEMHDYVNAVLAGSPSIAQAVSRWSGLIDEVEPSDHVPRKIGGLGLCKLQGPCPYHPTVTCYSCHLFRPSRDGDHQGALRSIEEQRRALTSLSTGSVKAQLAAEIDGARSLVLAILATGS